MNKIARHRGHVVIDDHAHLRDVDAACSHVGRHENREGALLEASDSREPLRLCLLRVQRRAVDRESTERASEHLAGTARRSEDDDRLALVAEAAHEVHEVEVAHIRWHEDVVEREGRWHAL